jgi:hypothetical protein
MGEAAKGKKEKPNGNNKQQSGRFDSPKRLKMENCCCFGRGQVRLSPCFSI